MAFNWLDLSNNSYIKTLKWRILANIKYLKNYWKNVRIIWKNVFKTLFESYIKLILITGYLVITFVIDLIDMRNI